MGFGGVCRIIRLENFRLVNFPGGIGMRVWNREVALSLALAIVVGLMSGCVGSVGPANDQNQPPVAPQITTQPADQSILAGASATFTVTATGTAPLNYQWQEKARRSMAPRQPATRPRP